MIYHKLSASFAALATTGVLALTACGSTEPPVFARTTPSSSVSFSPLPTISISPLKTRGASPRDLDTPVPMSTSHSASPTQASQALPTASASHSSSTKLSYDVAKASVKPIADFLADIQTEGAQAQEHQNTFFTQLGSVVPSSVPQEASIRESIAAISDTDIQPILQRMKDTLPYSNLLNYEGLSAQDQAYLLLRMNHYSVKEFESKSILKNIIVIDGQTIVTQDGPQKILFRDLGADRYEGDSLKEKVLLDEGYDFAVIKTGDIWMIDGARMIPIFEQYSKDASSKTT